ncbi:MAG: tyrosine-type recombinase/integrase [Nocardioides sp.]
MATKARNAHGKPAKTYLARYFAPTLERISRGGFSARQDARAWLDSEKALIDSGAWQHPEVRKAEALAAAEYDRLNTLESWGAAYIEDPDRALRPKTRNSYRRILRLQLAPLSAKPLKAITPEDVQRLMADPTLRKTPGVRAEAYRVLRALLNAAEDDGLIDRAPFPRNTRGRASSSTRSAGSVKRREVDPVSLAQLDRLVGAMPERLRLFAALAAWCGLREGELLELRRKDFIRSDDGKSLVGLVSVSRKVSAHRMADAENPCAGCGRDIGEPKTSAGKRTVAMPEFMMPLVREHLLQFTRPGTDGLVFTAPGKACHASVRYVTNHIKKAAEKAEIHDLRVHDLRHHALTIAGATGATAAAIQRRGGHSSLASMSIYQHAENAQDEAIAVALNERVITFRRTAAAGSEEQ